MRILVDIEFFFDKIQLVFMIQVLMSVTRGNIYTSTKVIGGKPTAL